MSRRVGLAAAVLVAVAAVALAGPRLGGGFRLVAVASPSEAVLDYYELEGRLPLFEPGAAPAHLVLSVRR